MITLPPRPPSPPEGPPRGTNFSRRNATQPLPPPPPATRIVASSMNIQESPFRTRSRSRRECVWNLAGLDSRFGRVQKRKSGGTRLLSGIGDSGFQGKHLV